MDDIEEETVETLKRKLAEEANEKNELKAKVGKLELDLQENQMCLTIAVDRLEQSEKREKELSAENGCLSVTKEQIISLPISRVRPAKSAKASRRLSEHMEVQ